LRCRLSLLATVAVVAGCAGLPDRSPVSDVDLAWRTHSARLSPLTAWEIHGRLALRTDAEGWHASVVWVRKADRHRIDLSGPLGRGHLRLTRDRDGAVLKDADQNIYRNASAEELLMRTTGYRLPLDGLDYWVRGLPAPGSDADRELDAWGRLARLRQLGWDIEFLEYSEHAGVELPAKLFARRLASVGPVARNDDTFEVRLVIENWALP
jgi:outer membrane lipoprotein LolB